jgi:hypothetical protein
MLQEEFIILHGKFSQNPFKDGEMIGFHRVFHEEKRMTNKTNHSINK